MAKRAAAETPESSTETRDRDRIAVAMRDDGGFDLDSMRPTTREKLKRAIALTPGLAGSAGPTVAPTDTIDPAASKALIGMLLGVLGSIEQLAVSRMLHCTPDQAAPMRYTAAEIELLTPPAERVLAKYGTTWLSAYGDEIALAGLIVTMAVGKVQAIQAAIQKPTDAPADAPPATLRMVQ